MDRYGNQFATRVEHPMGFSADIVQEATAEGWFRLVIGGIILSPLYVSKEDAMDAADVILGRLSVGEMLVEPMPSEEEDDYIPGDHDLENYQNDVLPTGWYAADHKAMYE